VKIVYQFESTRIRIRAPVEFVFNSNC
jgi:hypothetical protein